MNVRTTKDDLINTNIDRARACLAVDSEVAKRADL